MARFGRNKDEKKVKLEKGAYKRAMRVFKFISPYKGVFFIGIIFLILSSITSMGFPYLVGELFGTKDPSQIDANVDWKEFEDTNLVMYLLFGVFIANAIFSFFRIYLFSIVTEKTLRDLRNQAFNKLIHSPISFFDKSKVGELSSRIATDINLLQELLMTTLAEFIRQWLTVIFSTTVIAYTSPKLAVIMLSIVPVVLILTIIFGKAIKRLSKQAQDAAAESNSILGEVLTGIKNVKAFANESYEMVRYGTYNETIKTLSIKSAIWRGLFASFIIVGMFGAVSIVIWQGVLLLQTGELEMEEFMRFILFTVFLGASFGGIGTLLGAIQKAIGATERLMDIIYQDEETSVENGITTALKGNVSFENVGFFYETRKDVQVLKELNLNVHSGQSIAIVGPSGAGKSTLSSLLLRFYHPSSGAILFDGINANQYDIQSLRSNMAIVPQDVILFAGTIRENIAYGNVAATDEEIDEAAKSANAFDFVNAFPDGFDTLVGDRGIQLSGGQKQRIAIARAVLKNPKILILDEATSSLDSESEQLVQEALDRLMEGRTTFVIAHRLSTIKNADKIIVLEQGRLVESGTHDELVKHGGVYANLSSIQLG
ncbi:MAG: ABC transporter transmembrane domain-containing protein [Flavobacteriales bacterium]|jgi:ABC-type multidrug transport system fused ATPase/permease subunit|nr:ABC transporter transmembrane domain-containing protein [Flavobacteriales bacterium]